MADCRLILGDCLAVLPTLPADSFDSVVTDPPYDLTKGGSGGGFMGRSWDAQGVAFDPATWAAVLRVMKPGAYLAAFGGTRTYHRMVCAIEDAGFEISDSIMCLGSTLAWCFGSGFPKHKSKLKPAYEPIVLARKPARGATLLNVDACRVATGERSLRLGADDRTRAAAGDFQDGSYAAGNTTLGRYPPNLLLLHSPGCRPCGTRRVKGSNGKAGGNVEHAAFGGGMKNRGNEFGYADASGMETVPAWECDQDQCPVAEMDRQSGERGLGRADWVRSSRKFQGWAGVGDLEPRERPPTADDASGCSRFFPQFSWSESDFAPFRYVAKASKSDRGPGNTHPTVKPSSLVCWLARLLCPPGGTILDPFMGSGTTALACHREGFSFIGIEREPEYLEIARSRLAAESDSTPLFA